MENTYHLSFSSLCDISFILIIERNKFDAAYRKEARLHMNKEVKELKGKKIKYSFYDQSNKEINDFGYNYTILWYDARMKNYLDLIKNLPNKHLATNRIVPVLIVEKIEHMAKVYNVEKEVLSAPTKVVRRDIFSGLTDNREEEQK